MAYRYGDRIQMTLLPPSIEEYVAEDAPVRAYDAFVEVLDFDKLGIRIDPDRVGNSSYDPRAMLKLLVYGYSYGVRSSRKLERETHYNMSFMWLIGGLKPDHKTIAEFRRNNKSALKEVLKQCARLCIRLDLIAGNTLFVDGSKMRANASIKNSWTKKRCEKVLSRLDERIEEILSECDRADESESDQPSHVAMKKDFKGAEALRSKVRDILIELKGSCDGEDKECGEQGNNKPDGEKRNAGKDRKNSINTTDPDCVRVKGRQGSHAGYNAQIVVDEKNGLIVSGDVVAESNDLARFAEQIGLAHETLGGKCEVACADSGYANAEDLEKVDAQEIKVVVPSQRQASKKGKFDKQAFRYDKENDCYVCPEGEILTYRSRNKSKGCRNYRIHDAEVCRKCANFGRCTRDRHGRTIARLDNEALKEKFESEYARADSQEIYKQRMQKVELPFGHIKRNLGAGAFLLRGLSGVKAEMSVLSTCFNVARMITIFGVKGLIANLMSMSALNNA